MPYFDNYEVSIDIARREDNWSQTYYYGTFQNVVFHNQSLVNVSDLLENNLYIKSKPKEKKIYTYREIMEAIKENKGE